MQQLLSLLPPFLRTWGLPSKRYVPSTLQGIHGPRLRHRGETERRGRVTRSDLLGGSRGNFLERSVLRLRNHSLRARIKNGAGVCRWDGRVGG